ncbi:MAG: hypothetical protein ABI552_16020, partial [Casimicrobiaceae bacterium]
KAASDAKDAAELAHAQDRAVQNYAATERAKGVQVSPPGMSAGGSPGVSTGGTNAGGVATKPPSTKATPEKAMAHSPPTKQH